MLQLLVAKHTSSTTQPRALTLLPLSGYIPPPSRFRPVFLPSLRVVFFCRCGVGLEALVCRFCCGCGFVHDRLLSVPLSV